jgi:hypothetical protein
LTDPYPPPPLPKHITQKRRVTYLTDQDSLVRRPLPTRNFDAGPKRSLDDVDPTDVHSRVSSARKQNPDPVSGKVKGAVSESGKTGIGRRSEARGRGLPGIETMCR